jgi:hypothetical protein
MQRHILAVRPLFKEQAGTSLQSRLPPRTPSPDSKTAVLSIITDGGKWVELAVTADRRRIAGQRQHLMVAGKARHQVRRPAGLALALEFWVRFAKDSMRHRVPHLHRSICRVKLLPDRPT